MKILEKMTGSYSSEVTLVEYNQQKYVLKQVEDISEVISEKEFSKILAVNNIPSLSYFERENLKKNEILLEYVDSSLTLEKDFTPANCQKWGNITKKMHNLKYRQCFKFNSEGQGEVINWSDYIDSKIKRAFKKAEENNNYEFNSLELIAIREYLKPLLELKLREFSLIHGDLHSNNVLLRNEELVLFDKNSEIFSGDPLLDLAIAWVDMPQGSLIDDKNEKKFFEAFMTGYGIDFSRNKELKRYVVLIAFGRLYTPYSANYKEIIVKLIS